MRSEFLNSKQRRLKVLVGKLIDKECWSVIADDSIGTDVAFRFGQKIPFKRPLKNNRLTSEERIYDGEYWFYLQSCAWRLEMAEKILCGSLSLNKLDVDSERVHWLKQLVSTIVLECQLNSITNDLSIFFSNGFVLRTFCDQMWEHDNYSIGTHRGFSLTIGPAGKLVEEGVWVRSVHS